MRKVEKFIVLDVEGMSGIAPYNVGYIVADRNGKIYKKRSAVFPSLFKLNAVRCTETNTCIDMTNKNITEMLQDFEKPKRKRKYKAYAVNEFYKMFSADVQKYNVKKFYAFNVTFDRLMMYNLFGERFSDFNFEFRDIQTGIFYTRLATEKYCNWCRNHGFVTEKNNIQSTAEVVYKYLFGDLTFQEEHTGLSDVLIEYEILLSVFKARKKVDTWTKIQTWKRFKEIEEVN